MATIKRIGILTSGGDCAGLNPAIRAVIHRAVGTYGWEVYGILCATRGLLERPPQVQRLELDDTYSMLTTAGTILGTTNKGNPFAFPMSDGTICDRSEEIIEGYYQLNLDALIGVGGDGSLAILRKLAQQGGINLVAIPKTIDNDLGSTERAIGFDTAVNIATEALDRLHFTAASHSRVMILEVMGRDAGHIAISAGIAGGADIILIPEIQYSMEALCSHIQSLQQKGRSYAKVVVAESVCTESGEKVTQNHAMSQCRLGGIGQYLADEIASRIEAETRVTVLGHIQRGGIPSPLDRLTATAFGVAATDLIAEGRFDRMVSWQNRRVVDVPIKSAIAHYQAVDPHGTLVRTARAMGICLGEAGKVLVNV